MQIEILKEQKKNLFKFLQLYTIKKIIKLFSKCMTTFTFKKIFSYNILFVTYN